MKTGRNELCHCGSGQKYKRCCESKEREAVLPRATLLLVGAVVVLIGGGVAAAYLSRSQAGATQGGSAAPAPASSSAVPLASPAPQPPGPAPAGQVWSAEHGHWHDVPTTNNIAVQTQTSPAPGAAPAGKVWSEEHGHWHDAAAGGVTPLPVNRSGVKPLVSVQPDGTIVTNSPPPTSPAFTPKPQPPGPVPDGKVWSQEHGHWHDAAPAAPAMASGPVTPQFTPAPRPPGPAPAGKVWSEEHGHWHDAPAPPGN